MTLRLDTVPSFSLFSDRSSGWVYYGLGRSKQKSLSALALTGPVFDLDRPWLINSSSVDESRDLKTLEYKIYSTFIKESISCNALAHSFGFDVIIHSLEYMASLFLGR
jgi:hypothetical protein